MSEEIQKEAAPATPAGKPSKSETGYYRWLNSPSTRLILSDHVVVWKDNNPEIERHPEARLYSPMLGMGKVTESNGWPVSGGINGLSVVYGGRGAGKSEFIARKVGADVIIRVGEPPEMYDNLSNVLHFEGFLESFVRAVYLAKKGKRVAIDGARQLMLATGGAAMSGGVSSAILSALTNLSIFCAREQVHIVLSVNPMVDEDKEAELFQKLTASATGGWHLIRGEVISESHRLITGRTFSGLVSGDESDSEHPGAQGTLYGHAAFGVDGQDVMSNLNAFSNGFEPGSANPENEVGPRKGSRIVFSDKE